MKVITSLSIVFALILGLIHAPLAHAQVEGGEIIIDSITLKVKNQENLKVSLTEGQKGIKIIVTEKKTAVPYYQGMLYRKLISNGWSEGDISRVRTRLGVVLKEALVLEAKINALAKPLGK